MRTPARIKNHPVHPMLIPFPLALWGFSLAADLIYLRGKNRRTWRKVSSYSMCGGLIGAAVAAVPGFIDFLSIQDPKTRKIGLTHMALNLASVASYTINYSLRQKRRDLKAPITLSAVTMGLLAVSGWLGGTMVYEHHVGVAEPHELTSTEFEALPK